jgi:hypothetical protein
METEPRSEAVSEPTEIESRVAKGIALLDEKLGRGWPMSVDLDILNMADGSDCLLGQLMDGYSDAVAELWPTAPARTARDRVRAYHCQICCGTPEEFAAANPPSDPDAPPEPSRWELGKLHGFDSDDEVDITCSELDEFWSETVLRLCQERIEDGGRPQ